MWSGVKRAGTTETSAARQFVFDRIVMGWESRSTCRISETLSCAAISLHTRSTHSVVDKANGACLSPDRERLRAGTCEEGPNGFERSYALSADAGEHEPAAIRALVLKLVPPAMA